MIRTRVDSGGDSESRLSDGEVGIDSVYADSTCVFVVPVGEVAEGVYLRFPRDVLKGNSEVVEGVFGKALLDYVSPGEPV